MHLATKYESFIVNPRPRIYEAQYLKDTDLHVEYVNKGFVIIRNVVSDDIINHMTELFFSIKQSGELPDTSQFLNSGRVESVDVRNKVVQEIKNAAEIILSPLVNHEYCDIKTGGAFQIKPPDKNSQLNPHQDTPVIDETKQYAMYVWIPLCDVNKQNGTLSVLPGSHIWGNHQRSLNVPWIYERYHKHLWKYMVELEINKGDLICFDSALIHGSRANMSDDIRLAFTCAVLPQNFQLVHYFRDATTAADKVEKYFVDEFFFNSCNIYERPPENYRFDLEDWVGYEYMKRNSGVLGKLISLMRFN